MRKKVFEREKKIVRRACLPAVLPPNSIKLVSQELGIPHPNICNVSSGVSYNPKIVLALKEKLKEGKENIRIALMILDEIEV